jgi:heme-degrading monooxygenase HmoA
VLVVTRHRVRAEEAAGFEQAAAAALSALATRPGHRGGWAGPALDDPTLWTVVSLWASIGDARRALAAADTRAALVPLMASALDEPSVFDVTVTGAAVSDDRRGDG